jgi:uncharacterized protein (TIGR03067 family)
MKITRIILGVVSLGALFWTSGCATLHKSEAAALQGTWKGQEIGSNAGGTRYFIFSGNTVEFQGANNDDWCRGTFTVREDTNPRQIVGTITQCHQREYIGKAACGIYQLNGDTLTITGYEPGTPGVPSSFDAPGARHFVLQRD